MLATVRRIALAAAGAAALIAASKARADHEWTPPRQLVVPVDPPAYQPPYSPPAPPPSLQATLPAPPPWMSVAPPVHPAYGAWTRNELAREHRWLEATRIRFYRSGPWSPWQVWRFEAWYRVRRAELNRCWSALAWAPAPRYGWRSDRWHGRGGGEWRWNGWRGGGWRGDRERWEGGDE